MNGRRRFLATTAAAACALALPQVRVLARGSVRRPDARLVVVLLRGGLDGLHALAPYADPAYVRARADLVREADGEPHRLDGDWALHPALAHAARWHAAHEWLSIVAVAPPYRGRSHFDAQDCVENGGDRPHAVHDGWLNRCVAAGAGGVVAAAAVTPLIVRGPARIDTWSPPFAKAVDPDLLQRLATLYARDAILDPVFREALAHGRAAGPSGVSREPPLVRSLEAVGGFLAGARGARIAFVEDDGWDTHANEATRLARKLGELDAGLAALRAALGDAWRDSVVIVASEFGRTVAVNGTRGTDHGTAGVVFLAGGAVRGGRVVGDWPGLAPGDLNEGRDLRATTDLRAVFKGVLSGHLGVDDAALDARVFPASAHIRPLDGLVRAT